MEEQKYYGKNYFGENMEYLKKYLPKNKLPEIESYTQSEIQLILWKGPWVEPDSVDYFLKRYPKLKKLVLKEELPIENINNVVEVLMAEWATTTSDKKENILATYGAWPCIIVWWYSEWKAALMHISWMNQIQPKPWDPFKKIAEQNKSLLTQLLFFIWNNEDKEFKIIVSWWNHNNKQKEEILNYIQTIIWYNMKNKHEIIIGNSSSLAIDSKTWKVYKYDPLKNPNSREVNEILAMSPYISFTRYEYKK